MALNKITVIGTGECASAFARSLVCATLCKELMIVDLKGKRAQRLADDFKFLACANGTRINIKGSSYAKALEGSDIIIIAPAVYCKDLDSKEATFIEQIDSIKELAQTIKRSAPMSIVLCASDFDDYLLVALAKYTGFGYDRVIAIDPSIQALAVRAAFADKLQVNPADVDVHFKSFDDCIAAQVTIVGHDVAEFMDSERSDRIISAVSKEFHNYTGKARHAFTQAHVLYDFVEAIVNDHAIVRSIMTVAQIGDSKAPCLGSFSAVVSRSGIKRVIESEQNGYAIGKMKARLKDVKKCMT